jgi:hypothetical protein
MVTLLAQIPLTDDRREIASNLRATAESAKACGISVYSLPLDLVEIEAKDFLSYLRPGSGYSLFSGYIFSEDKGMEMDAVLREKGYTPINSVKDTFLALRFQNFYPLIKDLTSKSRIALDKNEAREYIRELGLPLFVKGDIKSAKEAGWNACIIKDIKDIATLDESRFPLVLRQIMPLRKNGEQRNGFPISREYRFYFLGDIFLGGGFYWGGVDPFGVLSPIENKEAIELARLAADRVSTPLLAIDVGQLENGSWKIIEIGDIQFSGIAHMSKPLFWEKLLLGITQIKHESH